MDGRLDLIKIFTPNVSAYIPIFDFELGTIWLQPRKRKKEESNQSSNQSIERIINKQSRTNKGGRKVELVFTVDYYYYYYY